MATIKEIKSRIKGIEDTQKITNAMYLIASTKLRKARNDLERTRPYFDALHREMHRIFRSAKGAGDRYFRFADQAATPGGRHGFLIITADRGMAGAYNQSVIREAQRQIAAHPDAQLFLLGDYGRRFFSKRGVPVSGSFNHSAQNPTMVHARVINAALLEAFDSGDLDEIHVIYTDMPNARAAAVVTERLLPFETRSAGESDEEGASPFAYFPSVEVVLKRAVENCLAGYIYSALVASFCGEQGARMAAMNVANQNAEKMLEALKLSYNQVRQAMITREITEISAGARAQKQKRKKEGVLH
ncbi:MAG: ATP synthase F1 subunit gamma [Christensenellales bacterium]|jgi:F-type H+-transporting ATPase subunit gamma